MGNLRAPEYCLQLFFDSVHLTFGWFGNGPKWKSFFGGESVFELRRRIITKWFIQILKKPLKIIGYEFNLNFALIVLISEKLKVGWIKCDFNYSNSLISEIRCNI